MCFRCGDTKISIKCTTYRYTNTPEVPQPGFVTMAEATPPNPDEEFKDKLTKMYTTLMAGAEANLTTWLDTKLEGVVRRTLAQANSQGATVAVGQSGNVVGETSKNETQQKKSGASH